MEYRQLGRSGIKVSEMCLGTMTFGRETDGETAAKMVDHYVGSGGNFVDTADVYGAKRGVTEEVLGGLLKGKRREVILATKAGFGPAPNDHGLSRKHLLEAVEASLRRLQTDWIDIYYLHIYDKVTPFEETLSALDTLVRAGKVRYIGVSNFTAWQIMKFLSISDARSLARFVAYQPQYNLLEREIEREFVPICQTEGLGMVCWAPLAGGFLSGKYSSAQHAEGRLLRVKKEDTDSWDNRVNEFTLGILKAVEEIAARRKVSCAQVALNWLRSRPWVSCPIIGARTFEQYEDNMACLGWRLEEPDQEALTSASERPKPYPYHFVDRLHRR